ncbi:hypothetical protein AWC32_16700 [Mycobacterium xenopi]|nr:hypothetical protein AWC32_16700 [Mycobacterium xenopi]
MHSKETGAMYFGLVSPDGCVASAGEFTDADARAPRGGLINQLATLIAARESVGLDKRDCAQ